METQQEATTQQEAMKKANEPRKEHEWLQKLVGEWTLESDGAPEPGQSQGQWTESVRWLGGLWTLAESQGEMPGGGTATSVMTLGYDPQKQRYVGTWVGSMMAHLWVYEGTVDATGKVLTLDTEGPDMSEGSQGKMAKYQDVVEFKSDDHRVLTSRVQGADGEWREFMTAHYRRKK
jgi:hypothetical protein